MDLNRFSHTARNKWTRYSTHEQSTIVYCLVLLCILIVAPLIKISQIATTWSDTFGLYNGLMSKSAIVITIAVAFLITRNSSFRRKQMLYKAFGLATSQTITTSIILFMILMQIFAIGDTVNLLKENISSRFSVTSWFLIIGLYLIGWIIRQLITARLQWKQEQPLQELHLSSEIDESRKERGFEQMEKEFQGLFEEEKKSQ
jgi:hypothetical protein